VCTPTPELLKGERRAVNVISHCSSKAPRVARSSLAVEVQGMSGAHEEMNYCRAVWADLVNKNPIDLKNYNDVIKNVSGTLVTDCRGLYDSVARSMSSAGGLADLRSAVEAAAIKQEAAWTDTVVRWCHSEAMPADALTKISEVALQVGLDFTTRGYWRLVQDPDFVSAKKRKHAKVGDILDDVIREPVIPEWIDSDDEQNWQGEYDSLAKANDT